MVHSTSSSSSSDSAGGDTTDDSGGTTTDTSVDDGSQDDKEDSTNSSDLDKSLSALKTPEKEKTVSPQPKVVPDAKSNIKRNRRYQLTTSMFKEYPLIKAYATGPKNPDRNPHKWFCRICHKNYSLKTRGGGGIVKHFRSTRHFRRDQRYRDSQKMPVYDRTGTVVTGDALENERLGFMAIKNVPNLDPKRLLVGQRRIPISGEDVGTNSILKSQISLFSEFFSHNAPLTLLPGMWGRFGLATEHSSLVSNYSWDDPQIFVSSYFSFILPFDMGT